MKAKDLNYEACGCCQDTFQATVQDGNICIIVNDNRDGTYRSIKTVDGLFVQGSARTLGPDDEVHVV